MIKQRDLDIFQHIQMRYQVKRLKYKTDFTIPNGRQLLIGQHRHILTIDPITAGSRLIQATQHIQQCRLAGARCTGDGDKFARFDMQRDIAQG